MPDGDLARTGLIDALLRRVARNSGQNPAITFAGRRGTPVHWDDAALLAATSQAAGALRLVAKPGDRALLCLPTGPGYVAALLGCFITGIIAVPAFPVPGENRRQERARLDAMVQDCAPAVILGDDSAMALAATCGAVHLDPQRLAKGGDQPGLFIQPTADAIAFLQYTSGSTASPKGVMVTHGNLTANLRTIQPMIGADDATVMVSWLPLYHDMGLIGGLLSPIFAGGRLILAPSLDFAERPRRWFELVSDYSGTITVAPNFAYQLCLDRIGEDQIDRIDLSSLKVMISGAEPIRPATMDAFRARFAKAGLAPSALRYFYGLAEATLMVSGTAPEDQAAIGSFDAAALEAGRAIAATGEARLIADCGPAAPGCQLAIVDPETHVPCVPGTIGEIWVSGDGVSSGYWRREAASAETMGLRLPGSAAVWLRTGDLGFVQDDGHLFVAGRAKDLIILRGRNIAPQDVEDAIADAVAGLRPGRITAFPLPGHTGERIGIAAELARGQTGAPEWVIRAIRLAVADGFEEAPPLVLLLLPGQLPRTTSGKLRRSACLPEWQAGRLVPLALHDETDRSPASSVAKPPPGASSDILERVTALWAEILGDTPAPDADFFLAGGHSLAAAALAARIEAAFGWTPPLSLMFTARSPVEQAAAITAALAAGEGKAQTLSQPSDRLFLAQQAIWFEERLHPGARANLIGGQVDITGPLDSARLARALGALAQRHPILHACIAEDEAGAPYLRPQSGFLPDIEMRDGADTAAVIAAFMARPFNLAAEPPLRALLLRLAADRHALVLATHHIALDGQGAEPLLAELGRLYDTDGDAGRAGLPALPDTVPWPLPVPADADFWAAHLQGLPPLLPLATDKRRTNPHDGQTWRVHRALSAPLSSTLAARAGAAGTTPAGLGLALFTAWLHRLSGGGRDIAVALPVSLRPSAAQGLAGSFMNTIVLRLAAWADMPVGDCVVAAGRALAQALGHASTPFADVVERLAPPRDGLHPPLARVMFNHRRQQAGQRSGFSGLGLGPIQDLAAGAPLDVTLEWVEAADGLSFNLDCARDLFSAERAEALADDLLAVAQTLGEDAERPLALLLPSQPAGRPVPGSPMPVTAEAAVRARVELHPALEALACENTSLTFAELDSRADGIARRLIAAGIRGEGQVIGLALSRSVALPAALIGIWRAGAAFLPLDPDYPDARLAYMLRDAGCHLVISDRRVRLPADLPAEVLLVEDITPAAPAETSGPHSEALAYIIYTSGSTGTPKGVAVSHGALARHLADFTAAHGIDERDTVLQSSTINFDVFLHELLPALMAGGRVVMRGPEAWSFDRLNAVLEQESVTVARIPTSFWRQWQDHLPPHLPHLRLVTVGGEALAGDALARWQAGPLGTVPVANLYGPTETTVACLYRRTETADVADPIVAIGRCYASRHASIRDQDGNPVRPGGLGELCIGGETLARGYWGRPGLTAERFLPDPDGLPGSRLYRTGDVAKERPDGTIAFLGRTDSQIKLRGIRIEPAEIEAAMRALPGVRDAVVMLRQEEASARLVGYVAAGADITAEALARHLAVRLPSAMLPSAFVILSGFPTLPNGKTDRAALPLPAADAGYAAVAPATWEETTLLAIWQEVLGQPRLGVTDDFFAAGGDSILSLRIVARARAMGLGLTPRQLFEAPTVARLAKRVERLAEIPAVSPAAVPSIIVPGLDPAMLEAVRPATPLQRGLLLLGTQSVADPYYVQHVFALNGAVDSAALRVAWQAAIARHAALRMGFAWTDADTPVMVIHRKAPLRLIERDWRHLDATAQAKALADDWANTHAGGFDFARPGPDLTLIRLGEAAYWLVWRLHHAGIDGWSLSLVLDEVARGLTDRAPAPSFVGYADWQASRDPAPGLAAWTARLATVEAATPLPVSEPQSGASLPYAEQTKHLAPARQQALVRLAAANGVTLGTLLQAAWGWLLARHAGQRDAVFGLTVSGRPEALPGVEDMAGLFINTLPLALRFDPGRPIAETLRTVQDQAVALWEDADLAPHAIQAASPLPAGQPLFDSILVLENYPIGAALLSRPNGVAWHYETPDRGKDGIRYHQGRNHYALSLIVQPQTDGGLDLTLAYATARFEHGTAARLLDQVSGFLDAMTTAQPGLPWGRIALPAPLPRDAASAPEPDFLARLARRAVDQGQETAIETPQASVTWAGLWARSGQVAARLAAAGVAAEMPVALALPRGPDVVIAVLAIWRAGGVAVPLDKAQPPARLAAVLRGCGAKLLIGTEHAPWMGPDITALSLHDGLTDDDQAPFVSRPLLSDQAAYVIHTSGSTGQPKGVVVSHGALAGYLAALRTLLPQGLASAAWVSTPAADLGHSVVFGALDQGWRLFIPDEDDLYDPARFASAMAAGRPDVLKIVPSHLRAVLNGAQDASALPARCLVLGGEAASPTLLDQIRGIAPDLLVLNHYGPTETTVGILAGPIPADTAADVPLGQALAHARVTLRDRDGNALPAGLPGEICAGGPAVARGYLGQPGLTAERFIPDDSGPPGSRLYRTGDSGWIAADNGPVHFLGRFDHQVKVNGYRVELADVEAALQRLPGIRAAVADLRPDQAGQPRLYAWVVGDRPVADVRAALAEHLPGPMLPTGIVAVAAMPLNANGKVDRAALAVPAATARPAAETRVADERETILRGIWATVLRLGSVRLDEDFFALGGDSIAGLQVVSRAREHGLHLSPRDVFLHPTVTGLARVAQTGRAVTRRHVVTGVDLPLTPIQRRFFARHPAGEVHWNQAVLLDLAQAPDAGRVEAAFLSLLARHDALRLRFRHTAAGWQQYLADGDGSFTFARADLRHVQDKAALDQAFRPLAETCQRAMMPEQGRLLSVLYADLPGGAARILIAIHHLAVDGVSWRILLSELQTVLAGQVLPPLTGTSWSRWAQHLADHAASGAADAEASWWRDMLAPADDHWPLSLPPDLPRMGESREVVVGLDPARASLLLTRAAAAWSLRPEEILVTALAQSLSAWRGRAGALIEMEGHGREDLVPDTDLSATIGWFTTRYPAWLPVAADLPPGEALVAVKESLRALPARGFHYGLAADAAAAVRPSVSFNYLGRFEGGGGDEGWRLLRDGLGATVSPDSPMAYLLDINALVLGEALTISFRFSPACLAEGDAASLAEDVRARLDRLITHVLDHPAQRSAADFPLSGLDQPALAALGLDLREVADIYPATDLQAGLLLHGGLNAAGDERPAYVNQLRVLLPATTDIAPLREAWRLVMARHTALRTGFLLRGLGQPLQVVRHALDLPVLVLDWRGETGDYAARLAAWQAADLAQGFDLARPPLMRLALIRRPDGRLDMIWTHHHALTDGWSNARLIGEVAQAYAAFRQGKTPALPPPVPYRDYLAWAARRPDAAAADAWWQARLNGIEEAGRLLDGPALPASPGTGMAASGQSLAVLMPGLRMAAGRNRVTLNTLFQAAWALVLSRLSGRRRLAFGITVSGRPHDLPGAERMVGLFINSLPLMLDLPGREPVAAFLGRLQAMQGDMVEHAAMPLPRLQRLAGMAGRPLFDSLLIFENYPLEEAGEGPLAPDSVQVEERTHYPLTLTILPGRDPRIAWSYDRALFDDGIIDRIKAEYAAMLSRLVDGDARYLGDIGGDGAPIAGAPAEPYRALLPRIAAIDPARMAIRSSDGTADLTYGALVAKAGVIAGVLGRLTEERIGLCTGRHPDLVAGLLGILMAGSAYVPMDPAYPAARLAQMVEDAGMTRILADAEGEAALETFASGVEIIRIDQVADAATAPAVREILPDQLAYVIYTSGSTGRPKGVGISHAALARTLDALDRLVPVAEGDRWLAVTSVSFDIAALELLLPLLKGAEIHLAERAEVVDGTAFAALMERVRPSILQATPSGWKLLLAAGWLGQPGLRALCGGEALPADLAQAVQASGASLVNVYGPTEATIWSSGAAVTPALLAGVAQARIGDPLAGEYLSVFGEDGMPGGVGELCIGGTGLARGYLGRPGLTAERFIPDAAGKPGSRLYRTGDLVRREDQGIAFLGRLDHQVKLRGYRIELGEVEAALRQAPAVRDAVAMVRDGQLIAYVTPEVDEATVRAHAVLLLPPQMWPSLILALPVFPLTPNGKLDRAALPLVRRAAGAEAPRNAAEAAVIAAAAQVLGADALGRETNFFQAGGDSILALSLVTRLQEDGLSLSVRQIFETPCLADLAAAARPYAPPVLPDRALPEDLPDGAEDAYPATAVQQGMVYHGLRRPGLGLYIGQLHLRLGPDVDAALLRRSFDLVTSRHAVLRTGFELRPEGSVRQVVYRTIVMPFVIHDWRDLVDDYASRFARWQEEDRAAGFDVAAAPLLRAALIRRPDNGFDFVWTSHHALLDGWSQSRLLGELSLAYGALRAGGLSSLAPVRPYRDYIDWLMAQDKTAAESWWRGLFAGAEPGLLLSALGQRQAPAEPPQACQRRVTLDSRVGDRLRAAARSHGLTLGTVLQGAWGLVLARYAGRRRVAFGITVSGRPAELPGVEAMLGLFINSLPLALDVPAEAALWPWLQDLQRLGGALRQHEHTPLTDIQRWTGRSGDALFDSLLVFENYPVDAAARGVSGDLAPQAALQLEQTHYPLTVMIDDGEDGLALRWLWDGEKIDRAAVDALRQDYAAILGWVADAALQSAPVHLGDLILPHPAPAQITAPDWQPILPRIAAHPRDHIAIRQGEACLTYGMLMEQARNLAGWIGPVQGEIIGLCCGRHPGLVAGLLGIMAAGGAYLPMDPAYPPARLGQMLADSGVTRILADADGVAALGDLALGQDMIRIDQDRPDVAALADLPTALPGQLAYVIYTSGSTGQPKGVAISQGALACTLDAMSNHVPLGAADRWLAVTSISFDIAALELLLPLTAGAEVVMADRAQVADGTALAGLIAESGATVMQATPSGWKLLVAAGWTGAPGLRALCGGEALPADLAAALQAGCASVVNVYGPTETTIWSSAAPVTPAMLSGQAQARLGPSLVGESLVVLSEDGLPVPVGGSGEIGIGGAGLAQGYLGRPGLTAERFVPDVDGPPGSRLYRTGDLGRRERGAAKGLVFLGRADTQVKLRGYRIELGEVEAALRAAPGVTDAVAIVRAGRLLAYVTGQADSGALRADLGHRLPAMMVPAVVMVLPQLPLTPNGKLDRARLPDPDRAALRGTLPVGETEAAICAAFATVTGQETVCREDDFFAIGGDSLRVMTVSARLSRDLGRSVAVAAIFQHPTPVALATYLDTAMAVSGADLADLFDGLA